MNTPNDDSLIYSIIDPKTGDVEKELSLLFLGMDLLDLDKRLEDSRSNAIEKQDSKPDLRTMQNKSPWWKLWQ